MRLTSLLILLTAVLACAAQSKDNSGTVLSSVLKPDYQRQGRSYYDRNEDRRCGRCDDDDDDDDDRDRDDDRRSNKPTYGSRSDRNKYDDDGYDDKKNKNGTSDDDKHDRDKSKRNRNRHRYDDRDRYRPDYYDRFLRDPYRNRYERPYDPYPARGYDYPYQDRYDDYRRPYDDRYDRPGYDRYGGYGPGLGRGAHDSFRPWDETYRGQAGWDDGGRGYYFASGRPDSAAWAPPQRDYSRPVSGGWQNLGYNSYRDQGYGVNSGGYYGSGGYSGNSGYTGTGGYAGSGGYGTGGYAGVYSRGDSGYLGSGGYDAQRYPESSSGYGQSSGWRNVAYTSRPYRDQSGVAALDNRIPSDGRYGQNRQPNGPTYQSTSTTPGNDYLFQREEEVTKEEPTEPSS